MRRALGLIETRSTVGLVLIDQMLKAANVEYEGSYKVDTFSAGAIRGDVGAMRVAIEAGAQEAQSTENWSGPRSTIYGDVERRLLHI